MRKILLLCVACLALMATSCGISREATSNANVSQTKVVLAERNYKVLGFVSGTSSQDYWFGIGGLSKKSLGESAMAEMYKNANLNGSQAIINVNVTYKSKFAFIYCGAKAIATGTVIQFVENTDEEVEKKSSVTSISVNHSDISINNFKKTDESDNAHYKLVFMKKKKSSSKWITEKEEEIYCSYSHAMEIADKWNSTSSSSYDFSCNIKKLK